jgi:hypothetical protein
MITRASGPKSLMRMGDRDDGIGAARPGRERRSDLIALGQRN